MESCDAAGVPTAQQPFGGLSWSVSTSLHKDSTLHLQKLDGSRLISCGFAEARAVAGCPQPGLLLGWRAAVEVSKAWVKLHGSKQENGEGAELIRAAELAAGVQVTGGDSLKIHGTLSLSSMRLF